ncbi:MazG nucleotide pyrophosphohydrolase domain-containing protein [Methanocella conradii]|uniref:MazG nucleotide pyrophosphohydrolase domain-containing protein n=1 Tax=Methanocella conradii TaxID=1175444 RepID=UPI0024B3ACBB|nr:MazG nucleotide pyrophosphohydrolase domain-containing protein [Methanocella conradii]MDI6897858.1 MazG nucleotide pyrophosphohydrolase domain-containing protein [Methanocella conradii]
MHISEFQRLMKDLYSSNDKERGLQKTQLWFFEEVGELAEAMRKEDKRAIEEEMADVLAWMASLANMLDIDVEKACISKYDMKCPRCGGFPCRCDKE